MTSISRQLVEEPANFNSAALFELDATNSTPKIVLDHKKGKVVISGSSSPLAPSNFFGPVLDWFADYKKHGKKTLDVYIILDYFNTYTSKFLIQLNREARLLRQKGIKTKIHWFCDSEDSDMYEFGELMKNLNKGGVEFCFTNEEAVSAK
ncbi:MAG: nuclear pore complex subunit [Bacteroidetes bacterium]|nr:nuclear pore complex subunit [Bacteroidota bacterium]